MVDSVEGRRAVTLQQVAGNPKMKSSVNWHDGLVDEEDGLVHQLLTTLMIIFRLNCGLGTLFFAYKFIVHRTLPVWAYLASFISVVCIRSWKSGSSVFWTMKDELLSVWKDLFGKPWALFSNLDPSANCDNSDNSNSKYDFLQEWLMWLSMVSRYNANYGPFSITIVTLFVIPINVLNAVWADAIILNLAQSIVLVARFIFLSFGFMQFFAIATHLAFHRLISHRSYQPTNRFVTFAICIIGALGGQHGPLWWASIHRRHHKFCDTEADVHSPKIHGPLYTHTGWMVDRKYFRIDPNYIGDWLKSNPELILIDATASIFHQYCLRYFPIVVAHVSKFILLKTRGIILSFIPHDMTLLRSMAIRTLQILLTPLTRVHVGDAMIMGFVLSIHFTSFTNSICHDWVDNNNKEQPCQAIMVAWVGYLNGGEGFHANHHGNAKAARHAPPGCFDSTYTVIKGMEWLGLVRIPTSDGEKET